MAVRPHITTSTPVLRALDDPGTAFFSVSLVYVSVSGWCAPSSASGFAVVPAYAACSRRPLTTSASGPYGPRARRWVPRSCLLPLVRVPLHLVAMPRRPPRPPMALTPLLEFRRSSPLLATETTAFPVRIGGPRPVPERRGLCGGGSPSLCCPAMRCRPLTADSVDLTRGKGRCALGSWESPPPAATSWAATVGSTGSTCMWCGGRRSARRGRGA